MAADLEALWQYLGVVREARVVGVNILIYGSPGTGKSEFTKVLAAQLGTCLFEVPNRFDDGSPILKGGASSTSGWPSDSSPNGRML